MVERADPECKGFQDRFFGLFKSRCKQYLYDRYSFCNGYISGKIVLDVPCGTGWGTSLLKGYTEVYGLDVSKEAIDYAADHFPGNYVVGDMTKMPYAEDKFEVVICLEGFEHITFLEGQKFIKEAKRILVPGGKLIMSVPLLQNRMNSRNPYHLCEYYEPELKEILEREFEIELYEKEPSPAGVGVRCVLLPNK